ncbi:MAG: TetR/AcrR family transcriptional regulator, partial [Brevibacterium yomogidense]
MTYTYRGDDRDVAGDGPGGAARIRDAAIDLYGRRGFDHVTLKDIAVAAGVSAPLVIHHYGSTAGLRTACDHHIADQINR